MAESRKVTKLFGAAGAALLALSGAALADGYEGSIKDAPADEGRKFTYSFSATGTSDYVFRGISQTDNDPTIQGAINIGYGIFYAGVWGSGLDWETGFGADPNAEIEIDYYGGIKPVWGPATFDFGVIYYTYPGTLESAAFGDTSILELKAGVSGEVLKSLTATGTIYYAPGVNEFEYTVYEGTLAYALPTVHIFTPTISGTFGYQDAHGPRTTLDYEYWNAGLTLAVEKLAFDFRYWDTDVSEADCAGNFFGGNTCDERFVFSATLTLP
jgi:uncharacterized protein (TIGR02001 family)